jgi:hypothetical protein
VLPNVVRTVRKTRLAGTVKKKMGKHARKKQKTGKRGQDDSQPLGSHSALTHVAEKDDEERRLESLLFGVPFVPSAKEGENLLVLSDDEETPEDDERELENMADVDVRQQRFSPIFCVRAFFHENAAF